MLKKILLLKGINLFLCSQFAADCLMATQESSDKIKYEVTSLVTPPKYSSKINNPEDTYERALKDPTYDGYYILRGYKIIRDNSFLISTLPAPWYLILLYYLSCKKFGQINIDVRGWADIAVRDGYKTITIRIGKPKLD